MTERTAYSVKDLIARLQEMPPNLPVFLAYMGPRQWFPADVAVSEQWDDVMQVSVEQETDDEPEVVVIRG